MTSMDEMRDGFSSISLWRSWSDGLLNSPSPVLKNMILRGCEALSTADLEKNRTYWREDSREAPSSPFLLAHRRTELRAGSERAPILMAPRLSEMEELSKVRYFPASTHGCTSCCYGEPEGASGYISFLVGKLSQSIGCARARLSFPSDAIFSQG